MVANRYILIDDDLVANMLSETLIKRHVKPVELHSFTDPTHGLAFIKENTLAATVLLDINMPKLSGWEVLQKLENLPKEVTNPLKIYILSSSIDPEDRQRADKHPLVVGYIEKPITDGFFGK
jgi:CheY-like chemotaxis protein